MSPIAGTHMETAMKILIALIALALAGCATTAADTRQTEPYRFNSPNPPAKVARCIIDNAEGMSGNFSGREDPPAADGERRVQIRHPDAGVSVVAEILPRGSGSAVTLWLSWQHFMARDTLVDRFKAGC